VTHFRPANATDVNFLLPLIAESSGGVWPAVWEGLIENGETIESAGARYLADTRNKLSIANTVVAEIDGRQAGLMTSYCEKPANSGANRTVEPLPFSKELQAALAPYRELSDPDSLFIAELCCRPEARGQGLGSQFLERAKDSAITQGFRRVTLRVFADNTGAVRLYQRFGFHQVDQRAVVPHPEITVCGSVLLMACAV